jgi:GH15 family glucan-1,4-alpha-glucosidase
VCAIGKPLDPDDLPVSSAGQPAIEDYALISDCHGAALVSRAGSIDWCCLPRFDHASCFGRLLDIERGGFCSVAPAGLDPDRTTREYAEDSFVLRTRMHCADGEIVLHDAITIGPYDTRDRRRRIVRVVEGVRGRVPIEIVVAPRFDYGDARPWMRREGVNLVSAVGGDDALLIGCDAELEHGEHEVRASAVVAPGERLRLSLTYTPPELLDSEPPAFPGPEEIDGLLDETIAWWNDWSQRITFAGVDSAAIRRSALTLKALAYEPTGAIVAAPTTSLPERVGGARNWDYRYSWIRDSALSSRSLAELGCEAEADNFRSFIERSTAGHVDDLRVVYGVGGERRLTEEKLDLAGYRGSTPVRIGNGAASQLQLDAYGELVNLAWRWHRRGHSPDDDHWRFLVAVVDTVVARSGERDAGIWERRDHLRHHVYSKVMCWAALDRALRLADESMRRAPVRRWRAARKALREQIESKGYDDRRGVFVQAFGAKRLDASLLLLPTVEFVDWDDERMVRTVAAIREDLGDDDGLLVRRSPLEKGEEPEGMFLACSFWLVECLARQGDVVEARRVFDRAIATANDVGLFAEEWDPVADCALGNHPQALSHLAHITAALALDEMGEG